MNKYRSHNCSQLSEAEIDNEIHLSGWLHRKRDHGNLLFIDLRDHFGVTQCVIENENKFFTTLGKLRPESVISVFGKVVKREKGTENNDLKTGKIEIAIDSIKILSEANELPLPVFGEQEYPEDVRLKYRFLDLRRKEMHATNSPVLSNMYRNISRNTCRRKNNCFVFSIKAKITRNIMVRI